MMPELTPLQESSPPRRPNSIFGQRFMTTSMPAASAFARRRVVAHAELHPDHLGADGDGIVDDGRHLVAGAEDIDHVDGLGNVAQAGIGHLAQQRLAGDAGIDRNDAIALALQIFHDEVARPIPVRRGADQRDGLHPLQDRAQLGVGIGDRLQARHGLVSLQRWPAIVAGVPAQATFSQRPDSAEASTASRTRPIWAAPARSGPAGRPAATSSISCSTSITL